MHGPPSPRLRRAWPHQAMKNTKNHIFYGWVGASYDASSSLRVPMLTIGMPTSSVGIVPAGQMTAVSRQDMVNI